MWKDRLDGRARLVLREPYLSDSNTALALLRFDSCWPACPPVFGGNGRWLCTFFQSLISVLWYFIRAGRDTEVSAKLRHDGKEDLREETSP